MKKIALFSDGTGNSSANPNKTNVWRAYKALDCRPGKGQVAFYDNGVGTSSFRPMALLGRATGWGLKRNVKQIYGYLCRTYEPGDKIYAFGFSRGAFTIRVVVALIASQGIIDPKTAKDERDLDRLISAAYRKFRSGHFTPSFLSVFLRPLRDAILRGWQKLQGYTLYDRMKNHAYPPEQPNDDLITFVGIWDTVDAYGLPVDELTRAWDRVVWPLTFRDRNLSPRVKRACHALALDERRESFEPTLWNEENAPLEGNIDATRIAQVWFAGVHSNIGGGYPDDGLSLVAFNWVLDESERFDGLSYLKEERERFANQADRFGPLYDSRKGFGNVFRYAPRNLDRLCREERPGLANWIKKQLGAGTVGTWFKQFDFIGEVETNAVKIVKPKIHHTVFERITGSGNGYAPINIPNDYALVDKEGAIIDLQSESPQPLPESAAAAKTRRRNQSYTWNKVWLRKLLYYATFVFGLIFLFYPYLRGTDSNDEGNVLTETIDNIFGAFSTVFRALPAMVGKIPGLAFAGDWANDFAIFPYAFLAFLLILLLLLAASFSARSRIKREMRGNWSHVTGLGSPVSPGKWRKKLALHLDDLKPDGAIEVAPDGTIVRSTGGKVSRAVRIVFESLAVLLMMVLVLAAASRTVFFAVNSTGFVCQTEDDAESPPNESAEREPLTKTFTFDPRDPCDAMGVELEQRSSYRISMRLSDGWADANILANINGWRDADWYLYLLTPFRRHLFAGWYQPIVRVGGTRFERIAFEPDNNANSNGAIHHMIIKPRRKGWLYLYVNDAVFLMPGVFGFIYRNNKGDACVCIQELPREGKRPAPPEELCCDAEDCMARQE